MGLLDDAIREHLDLKRRRGADPAEVERLEREALGPVRRGPAPLEAGTDIAAGYEEPELHDEQSAFEPVGGYADEVPPAYEQELTSTYEDETAAGHRSERLAHQYEPSAPADADFADEEPHEDASAEPSGVGPLQFRPRSLRDRLLRRDVPLHEEVDDHEDESRRRGIEPPRPAAAPPLEPEPQPAPPYGQETVEYRAVDDPSEPDGLEELPPQRGEAILEETPEFLQDTPDHDRLWFEQRPPRDFDFDG